MSDYKHCASGLALYFGAESEYKATFNEIYVTGPIDGADIDDIEQLRGFILFLRPLSAMTEEENNHVFMIEYKHSKSRNAGDLRNSESTDYLRSKGFDCGGMGYEG